MLPKTALIANAAAVFSKPLPLVKSDLTLSKVDFEQSYDEYISRLKQLKDLILLLTDDFVTLYNTDEIKINYCPICGRKR